jgi:hypothetical protein
MGILSDNTRVARAHRGGGTTVGWHSRAQSTAFGGDGAGTVVADGRGVPCSLEEEGNE